MKLVLAFVCDYAQGGAGKLSAMGIGFDTVFAPAVPYVLPNFHFVAKLSASTPEAGTKKLRLVLMDPDGQDVIPAIEGTFAVIPPSQGYMESFGIIAIGFNNVRFMKYGPHSLHLLVEGNEMISIPIMLSRPPGTE